MPSKTEEYLALAQRTANGLTRYWESWTDYLTTASRLYKYPFADQLMIYAQRPDATACADFDIWNNRMNRYVRRGAKGIALLDESSGFPRLHYVFDVSDTGVRRNSRDPEVWQLGPDLVQPVSEMLSKTYGISGERVSQQLADVAGKLVADYWDNNGGDIRAIVNLRLPDGETRRKGIDSTKYLWVAKLRCRCGSSYRIFNWRKLKDGTPVFGYQCNMRTVNPTRSFVLEHNMTEQLSCDAISIPEWKLELMAKKIFEKVWGNQNKAILRACKMIESCQNGKAATRMSAAPIQGQIEKIKKRKLNYAAMRADGELPREEYQALCKQADDEIAHLEQELKALSPAPEPQTVSSDMKAIYDFLSQKVDVHGARLAPELIDQFVEVVTPIADYSYRWKLNTGCKKSKEERADLMAVSEKPILTFTIDFETAKRYREANKMPHQFRRAAWTDLTVEVYL